MNIHYAFVPQGTVVDAEGSDREGGKALQLKPGQVYLDVGNRLCERILDHHFAMDSYQSATEACVRAFDLLVAKPLKGHEGPITLITHQEPDLDGAMAIFYARERLMGLAVAGREALWERVVEMVSANDQGYATGSILESFPILFRALTAAHETECEEDPERFLTHTVFPMIQDYLDQDADTGRLWTILKKKPEGRKLWSLIERADAEYQEDRRRGRTFQAFLPSMVSSDAATMVHALGLFDRSREEEAPRAVPPRNPGSWCLVDGIILNEPRSLLFKELCRTDATASPLGHGFTLMVVHRDVGGAGQHIISVDPIRGVTLEGLGGLLEAREKAEEAEGGRTRRDGDNQHHARTPDARGRHGYQVVDPWYDGRGHAFTIIDNPNSGSVLTSEEVNEVVWGYGSPGHHALPMAARATFFLQVHYNAHLNIASFSELLAGHRWRSEENPLKGPNRLLPSVARGLVPVPGKRSNDTALHFVRDLAAPEGLAFLPGARERLVLFPEGIGLLRIEFDASDVDVFSLGTLLAGAQDSLRGQLRTVKERAALTQTLGIHEPFALAKDGEAHHFFQLQFQETELSLDSIQTGLKACLYQLARCVAPEFHLLPHARALEALPRLFYVDGRKEAWILPDGCMSLEIEPHPCAFDEGEALLLSLAHFQKEYFVLIANAAAHATDQISNGGLDRRRGLRALESLHRDLVEFMSRWRLDEVTSDPWNQAVYQSALQALRIHELGLAARDRVSQMAELILAEREREQNRFLGFITLFFLPVSLVAGLFSGLQMQPPSTSLMVFPWLSRSERFTSFCGPYANWVAFACYIMAAVVIALLLWSTVLIRRKRSKMKGK